MSKKRKLDQTDDMLCPSSKRAKGNDGKAIDNKKNDPWQNSEIFKNNKNQNAADKQQWKNIFDTVRDSQLIKVMNIPDDIVPFICDYGVGNLVKCWKSDCDQKISFLQNEKYQCAIACKCGRYQYLGR